MSPDVLLGTLRRADGSSNYSHNGYSVLCAVTGPVEIQRRDELPEEAVVDVAIRPSAGIGGVRERHFESIIQKALRHVVKVSAHPRTLIQVTLQVLASPEDDSASGRPPQAASNLQILPHLINAAILGLLSTSIPLEAILTSTIIAIRPNGMLVEEASLSDIAAAASLHVLAFSPQGELVVIESEGSFDMDVWEEVVDRARHLCLQQGDQADADMQLGDESSLEGFIRKAIGDKITMDSRWGPSIK